MPDITQLNNNHKNVWYEYQSKMNINFEIYILLYIIVGCFNNI